MSAARTCSRLFGALLERRELFVGPLPEQGACLAGECGAARLSAARLSAARLGAACPSPAYVCVCVSVCPSQRATAPRTSTGYG